MRLEQEEYGRGYLSYALVLDGEPLDYCVFPSQWIVGGPGIYAPVTREGDLSWDALAELLEDHGIKVTSTLAPGQGYIPPTMVTKRAYGMKEILEKGYLRAPLVAEISAERPAWFTMEPVTVSVSATYRGVGFWRQEHRSAAVMERTKENPPLRVVPSPVFAIPEEEDTPGATFPDGSEKPKLRLSMKLRESKRTSVNLARDAGVEAVVPGDATLQLHLNSWTSDEPRGPGDFVTTTNPLDLKIVAFEKAKFTEEARLETAGGAHRLPGTMSLGMYDSEATGRVRLLAIESEVRALFFRHRWLSRILRVGDPEIDGEWSLARDAATGTAHILCNRQDAPSLHWQTAEFLTTLLPPREAPGGQRWTVKAKADGAVEIQSE